MNCDRGKRVCFVLRRRVTPGMDAGRGIITAFEALEERNAFEVYKPDVVIYDAGRRGLVWRLCHAYPEGYADKVFIVTSGGKYGTHAAVGS